MIVRLRPTMDGRCSSTRSIRLASLTFRAKAVGEPNDCFYCKLVEAASWLISFGSICTSTEAADRSLDPTHPPGCVKGPQLACASSGSLAGPLWEALAALESRGTHNAKQQPTNQLVASSLLFPT